MYEIGIEWKLKQKIEWEWDRNTEIRQTCLNVFLIQANISGIEGKLCPDDILMPPNLGNES